MQGSRSRGHLISRDPDLTACYTIEIYNEYLSFVELLMWRALIIFKMLSLSLQTHLPHHSWHFLKQIWKPFFTSVLMRGDQKHSECCCHHMPLARRQLTELSRSVLTHLIHWVWHWATFALPDSEGDHGRCVFSKGAGGVAATRAQL